MEAHPPALMVDNQPAIALAKNPVLHDRSKHIDRIDAAVLAEELAEIYSTPTPKGWSEPKKVNNWYLIDCVFFYNSRGLIFIPGTYA